MKKVSGYSLRSLVAGSIFVLLGSFAKLNSNPFANYFIIAGLILLVIFVLLLLRKPSSI